MRRRVNFELQHRASGIEALLWGLEVETLARSGVEFVGNDVALTLGECSHAGAFGEVRANQAIGIFIGAALPGVMGGGEVELQSERALDRGIAVELGAVVGDDGAKVFGVVLGQANGAVVELMRRSRLELADQEVAGFALHRADDAMLVAVAHHGVDLPVAELAASKHPRRAFGDMALTREAAAAVIGAVAFAEAALACATQMLMQGAPAAPIVPDVAVDGLVADLQALFLAQEPRLHCWRNSASTQCSSSAVKR